jgi:hypothetical protein
VFLVVHRERSVAHGTWTRNKELDTTCHAIKKSMAKLRSPEKSQQAPSGDGGAQVPPCRSLVNNRLKQEGMDAIVLRGAN